MNEGYNSDEGGETLRLEGRTVLWRRVPNREWRCDGSWRNDAQRSSEGHQFSARSDLEPMLGLLDELVRG